MNASTAESLDRCVPFKMTVKQIIISTLLLLSFHSYGQNYILSDGEYMDTTSNVSTTCRDYNAYYYQVNAKYFKSSVTLVKDVQTFLQQRNKSYQGSGYITFRFRIDCAGQRMKKTQVLQTDERYKSHHFSKDFVNELYLFLNTLNDWKIAKDSNGNTYSYNALITFKIKNGKVIDIIP